MSTTILQENDNWLNILNNIQLLRSARILQGMLSENTQKMHLYFSEISLDRLDETRTNIKKIEKDFCLLDKLLVILGT